MAPLQAACTWIRRLSGNRDTSVIPLTTEPQAALNTVLAWGFFFNSLIHRRTTQSMVTNQDDNDFSDHPRWRDGGPEVPNFSEPTRVPSFRAQLITRRTYNRPLNDEGTKFETWEQTVDRVIRHQKWLWKSAQGQELDESQINELQELRQLILDRKVSLAGRTLWLGGTKVSRERAASMFNCSFLQVQTVHDVVDAFWLLLQGCGVGFEPVPGILNGFTKPVEIVVHRSKNLTTKGQERNSDCGGYGEDGLSEYYLQIGDSAEAWAKSVGKLLAMKNPVDRIVLDFSEIRAAGHRLRGYGWISSGDETISVALVNICNVLSRKAGQLLDRIDILDILNHLGTTLSSRRSAEIALVPWNDPEAERFAYAKKDYWLSGNTQRAQSNNSVVFYEKPSKAELRGIFAMMLDAGGSEPGFINGAEARRRAPWFKGVNPCAEILLGNRSFCNLCEVDLAKFNGLPRETLYNAVRLVARANYRQTCVDLDDGVLQRSWHELNQFLRLTGVSLTGIARWEGLGWNYAALTKLRKASHDGAHSMADELGLPRSKAVTTIKPSGTISKVMDTTEGAHKPLGRYIFNNIRFSKHDPLVQRCREAGYRVFDDPYGGDAVLVTVPVAWEDVEFEEVNGLHVNTESAVSQLDRYKWLMDYYVDHNCSITVSYDPSEVPAIVDWLNENWDSYVGVSFLLRADPTKTAQDLGYPYLPQEVVSKEVYEAYVATLEPIDIEDAQAPTSTLENLEIEDGSDCAGGVCPVR
jgi:adenosylcobalamin-dependent ribonucleoside-triphosphate reductase